MLFRQFLQSGGFFQVFIEITYNVYSNTLPQAYEVNTHRFCLNKHRFISCLSCNTFKEPQKLST